MIDPVLAAWTLLSVGLALAFLKVIDVVRRTQIDDVETDEEKTWGDPVGYKKKGEQS